MLSPGQDIPGRLLAQQKSLVELEQYLTGCKEKKQELKKTLKELEMKLDELKFCQPSTQPGAAAGLRIAMPKGPPPLGAGGHGHGRCPNRASLPLSPCSWPPLLHWEGF